MLVVSINLQRKQQHNRTVCPAEQSNEISWTYTGCRMQRHFRSAAISRSCRVRQGALTMWLSQFDSSAICICILCSCVVTGCSRVLFYIFPITNSAPEKKNKLNQTIIVSKRAKKEEVNKYTIEGPLLIRITSNIVQSAIGGSELLRRIREKERQWKKEREVSGRFEIYRAHDEQIEIRILVFRFFWVSIGAEKVHQHAI